MSGAAIADRCSLSELTRAVFGEELSIDGAWARIESFEMPTDSPTPAYGDQTDDAPSEVEDAIWVVSVGYERHKDHREFARHLNKVGVERLIDVRDLPISRRRGYAKTALSEALAEVGVEYVHAKALGNPKPYRDLYKAGNVDEGRERYREHLVDEHLSDLEALVIQLREKPSALMCVEHDPSTCHRTVIVEAIADELDVQLDVAEIA